MPAFSRRDQPRTEQPGLRLGPELLRGFARADREPYHLPYGDLQHTEKGWRFNCGGQMVVQDRPPHWALFMVSEQNLYLDEVAKRPAACGGGAKRALAVKQWYKHLWSGAKRLDGALDRHLRDDLLKLFEIYRRVETEGTLRLGTQADCSVLKKLTKIIGRLKERNNKNL